MNRLQSLALAVVLAATCCTAVPAVPSGLVSIPDEVKLASAPSTPETRIEAEVIRLTNIEREKHSLGPLTAAPELARAACNHSTEMCSLRYFSHNSPNSNQYSVKERVATAGGTDTALGENLSKLEGYPGSRVAEASVQGWMHSPEHRVNMLNPAFNRIGVGVVENGRETYVTQVFSVRCIDVLGVTPKGFAGTQVTGRVLNGSHHLGLFCNNQFVKDFAAAQDGSFAVACPGQTGGRLALGQEGESDATDTSFTIVSALP